MAVRAKKLKELKNTVCKKCASARWIERSGVMKKKLASVLKVMLYATTQLILKVLYSAINWSINIVFLCAE